MINVTIKPKLYINFFFHEHLFNTQIVHEKLNILSFFFYAHLYNPWMMVCATCVMEGGGAFQFRCGSPQISSAPLIFLWRRQRWNASTVVHMSDSPCITRRTGHCSHLTSLSLRWRLILRGFSYRIYIQPTSRNIYTIIVNRAQFTVVYCTHDSNKNVLLIIK